VNNTSAWRLLTALEQRYTEDAMFEFGHLHAASAEAAKIFENAGPLVKGSAIHGEDGGYVEDERDHDTLLHLRDRRHLALWARDVSASAAILRLKHLNRTRSSAMRKKLDTAMAAIFTEDRINADAAMRERAQADDWLPEYVPMAEMKKTTAWGILDLMHEEGTARHKEIVRELAEVARHLSLQSRLEEEDLFTVRRHHLMQNVDAYERTLRELNTQGEWLDDIRRLKLKLVNDWDFTRGDTTFARTVFAPETLKPDTSPAS
jgi:hypothetical protein